MAGLLLACGKMAEPPAKHQKVEGKEAVTTTTAVGTARCPEASPESMHLGDGTTSYNYYFIAEELERRPGSMAQTQETLQRQKEAELSSGMNVLKPPSANVVETEFSHLLGAVMQNNGGIGAAVFNSHGLKIGAAGLQLEAMLLPELTLRAMLQAGADDPPAVHREGDILRYYRPVFGVNDKAIGVGMLVVQRLPHCQ
jgi:hypothetical protein